METDEAPRVLPFQLQFDKPLASQIKIAEWNPEKDLLAMVTEDSKLILHRFNWQRLWTISPGRCITSLCWRPDGKVIAVGLEDGNISLHDVENGKLLRSLKSHTDAVVSLNWVEDEQPMKDNSINILTYEDRTSRFFPPAPRVPRRPGFVSGDTGFVDDSEDSFHELSSYSYQRSNILCSGDKRGSICFSIFGIFPVGKINIQEMSIPSLFGNMKASHRLQNASIHRVALSTDFRHLIVMCTGQLSQEDGSRQKFELSKLQTNGSQGLHCLKFDTTIFEKRKNELHQLAQQASNVEDLIEVIRASLSVMCKQWTDAMHLFHEKFDPLSSLIVDHGLESSPQEEFLSLLGGARTSPPIHQFLVNSLGEVGLKRISKVVCGAGKELQNIVLDHLQPAAEIIGFRMGELHGLSRWRAHYKGIGLDETLINDATEMSGMFLAQVERFMMLLSSVVLQFSNFFNWLLKCVKILMQETSDQLAPYNSELVVVFLKLLYDQDPVRMFIDPSAVDYGIEIDVETMQRNEELIQFGGFSNCDYLRRTLEKEFQLMESSLKEAFFMPFTTVSQKIICEAMLPLFPLASSLESMPAFPLSVSYYKDGFTTQSTDENFQQGLNDYISFRIPDDSFSDIINCIGVFRGFTSNLSSTRQGSASLEATWLSLPHGYECVDLCLYKERQIVLLLNETTTASDGTGESCLMILQASDLPFVPISGSISPNHWNFDILKGSVVYLERENEKVRTIPHAVVAPLAVSASRGVACIFAAKRRALVYILDEDEDEATDTE